MDQLTRLISSFTVKQRVSIVVAAVLAIALLVSLSRWNSERDFRPL